MNDDNRQIKRKRLTDILSSDGGDNFRVSWNSTEAADEFGPLPPGEYAVRILSGDLFTSRRNNTPGYKLTCEVTNGDYAGCRLWLDFWLTPAALPMTKRDLVKIGVEKAEQLEQPLPPGILLKVKVAQRRDDEGNVTNKVTRFDCTGTEPDDAFAPNDREAVDTSLDPPTLDKPKETSTNGEQLQRPSQDAGRTSSGTLFPAPSQDAAPYGKGGDRR